MKMRGIVACLCDVFHDSEPANQMLAHAFQRMWVGFAVESSVLNSVFEVVCKEQSWRLAAFSVQI